MTHEFKTPLSSILLASEALNKQEVVQENPKLKTYTSIIINQSYKLNNHIEKILNIAKNDASGLSLKPQKIILKPFIEEIAETIKQKNENISIQIDIENDISILADEFHFTNIVYNLLDNSIKYCETKPEILISSVKDSKGLYLKFKDNGMGIPAKNINHIFDKFYRVPVNNSDEINGFGLGLFYVKKSFSSITGKYQLKTMQIKALPLLCFFRFNLICVNDG